MHEIKCIPINSYNIKCLLQILKSTVFFIRINLQRQMFQTMIAYIKLSGVS